MSKAPAPEWYELLPLSYRTLSQHPAPAEEGVFSSTLTWVREVHFTTLALGGQSTFKATWAASVCYSSRSQMWETACSASQLHTPRSSRYYDPHLLVRAFALSSPHPQTFHRGVLPSEDRLLFISPVSAVYAAYSNSRNGSAPLQTYLVAGDQSFCHIESIPRTFFSPGLQCWGGSILFRAASGCNQ